MPYLHDITYHNIPAPAIYRSYTPAQAITQFTSLKGSRETALQSYDLSTVRGYGLPSLQGYRLSNLHRRPSDPTGLQGSIRRGQQEGGILRGGGHPS